MQDHAVELVSVRLVSLGPDPNLCHRGHCTALLVYAGPQRAQYSVTETKDLSALQTMSLYPDLNKRENRIQPDTVSRETVSARA